MVFESVACRLGGGTAWSVDGRELIPHEPGAREGQAFDHDLVAVFVLSQPPTRGANPWRSAPVENVIAAIDRAGATSLVDPAVGEIVGKLEPVGPPTAVAASTVGAALAIAVRDRVILWRDGERRELSISARALAFSRDGATLALATTAGELIVLRSGGDLLDASRVTLPEAAIADLAQAPDGSWLALGAHEIYAVGNGTLRATVVHRGGRRLRFDADGERLAVHDGRTVVVYAWPSLVAQRQIESLGRSVQGLIFGTSPVLYVGLDHGDVGAVDLATGTPTLPEPQRRSWKVRVDGHEMVAGRSRSRMGFERNASRLITPIVLAIAGALAALTLGIGISPVAPRAAAQADTNAHVRATKAGLSPSYVPVSKSEPAVAPECGRTCIEEHFREIEAECIKGDLGCAVEVRAARKAFDRGDCAEARRIIHPFVRVDRVEGEKRARALARLEVAADVMITGIVLLGCTDAKL